MQFVCEIKKEIECDILVVGGGVAGYSASVCGAKEGANVVLCEQLGYLGGTATSGLVAPFMTCFDKAGENQIIKGVFKELIDDMIALDGAIDPALCRKCDSHSGYKLKGHLGTTPFDKETMKFVMENNCKKHGVQLRYHHMLVGVNVEGRKVTSCDFATKSGIIRIRAKQFIDCSGDADLVALAGGRTEYAYADGENLQPVSTFFLIDGVDKDKLDQYVLPKTDDRSRYFMDIVEDERKKGNFPCGTVKVRLYEQMGGIWSVNMCQIDETFDVTDVEQITQAEIEGRRQARIIFDMLKRRVVGLENIRMLQTSETVGVRESRKIVGEYKLTLSDINSSTAFEDGVVTLASSVDVHTCGAVNYVAFASDEPYTIPYRSLVHKDFDNVLSAGKTVCADRFAHGAVRVMPPAMAMGQAVGVGAVLAIKNECKAKEVDAKELRSLLIKQGAYLI